MGFVPEINEKTAIMWDTFNKKIHEPKSQRKLVLVTVCIALLLDNMLYMVIVPIIPNYLRDLGTRHVVVSNVNQTNYTWIPYTTPAPTGNDSAHNYTEYHERRGFKIPLPPPPVSYGNEGGAVGVLFASKAIIQLCVNPFTGTLIDRIGYDVPMMIGLIIMFLSTSVFAFGESYAILFLARSLQGLGSAFADVAGLAMIADRFTEENERSKALGIAIAFISFGCLFAPPFGGILYQFAGKLVPFLILALACLIDGMLLLMVMKPVRLERSLIPKEERVKGTPIYRLLMDPYILCTAVALAMANVSLAFLEPTISLWMKDTMAADEWEIGFVWLPAFIPHICGVYLTVRLARNYPSYQWLMAMIGIAIEGSFCLICPFSESFGVVIIPIMGICFGIALVDTALLPLLGHLVDVRHVSVYGSVYAIADISYSVAYAFGPIVAGSVVQAIGFTWLNVLIFLSNILYAPVLLFLRNIYKYKQFEDESDVIYDDPPSKQYNTYMQNGGVNGKPLQIETSVKNHLETKQRLTSGEIDCYPPTDNNLDFLYKNQNSFYQQ